METQTHWKKLTNPDYLGSHDLFIEDGKFGEITVTVVSVASEMVKGADGKATPCIVAKLAETKPIILNKTNLKMITKVTGTPVIEKWAGQKLVIGTEKVKAFGDVTDALRVRNVRVQSATSRDFTNETAQIQKCTTLDELKSVWVSLDAEAHTALVKVKDDKKNQLTASK